MNTADTTLANIPGRSAFPLWQRAAIFSVAYFLLAEAARFLSARDSAYVSFWLPAGLYVSVLLLNERRAWPWLVLAALPANLIFDLVQGTRWSAILLFYCANTVQAVTGAWLVNRFVVERPTLATLKGFVGLLGFAAVFSPLLGGALGAAALSVTGLGHSFAPSFKIWWGSNAMAILLLAPLVLSWFSQSTPGRRRFEPPKRGLLEAALLLGVLIALSVHLLALNAGVLGPYKFQLLLPLLWAGLRFGPRGSAAANLLVALLISVCNTEFPAGSTPEQISAEDSLFVLQTFLAVAALVGLIPAIVLAERDRTMTELRESEERFRNLTAAAFEGIGISANGRLVDANDQLLKMFGYGRSEIIGREVIELVAPESRAAVAESIRLEREEILQHRLLRRDGSSFYAEARAKMVRVGDQKLRMTAVRDITERKQAEELTHTQRQTLEMIALGKPMLETLDVLLRMTESQSPEMLCSILLLDADGIHIRHGAAPSLPSDYLNAINGSAIGPRAGSCGTAAFRREAVFVQDIETDALWADYKHLALPHGLRACWSTPIFDAQRHVLGTFAMYYRQPGMPNERHLRLIDMVTQTAAVCIGKHRSDQALRESETRLRMLTDASFEGIGVAQDGLLIDANDQLVRMLGYRNRSEMIGKSAIEFAAPESREYVRSLLASGWTAPYEHLAIRKDGSVFPVEVCGRIIAREPHRISLAAVRDITERKRAEAALRESEERYRTVVEFFPECVAVSVDDRLVYVNPAGLKLVGLEGPEGRAKLIGRSVYDFMPAAQHGFIREGRRDVLRRGVTGPIIQGSMLRPDGSTVTAEGQAIPFVFDGRPAILSVIRDITERKRAEAALRESEEKFSKAFRSCPDAVALSEFETGRYIDINEGFERLFGFSREEVIGRTALELGVYQDPSDRGRLVNELRAHGLVRDVDLRCVKRHGEPLICLYGGELIELGGRPCIVSVIHDITDRVRADEALRENQRVLSTLLSNLPGMVYRCQNDADWTMHFVSEGCRALTGYAPEDLLGNRRISYGQIIHSDDQHPVFETVQAALGEHQPFELSYRIHSAGGAEKWVWERGRGIFSATGELLSLEGFITDITAQRRAEIERADAQLRERQAREQFTGQLIASQEAERQRIAGELHDSLGQNLLLIKNRAQLALASETAPGDSPGQLEGILELASHAIAEVRQISQNLHPYLLDQLGLTRAIGAMIDNAAQSSSIVFQHKLEPVDDLFGAEAATNLYRVVQETVNNILKHSQATHARIILERDLHHTRLWIEDDGRGFAPGPAAAQTTARGLGLKNIAERVRILGGSLTVDSRPGAGTRIESILPISEPG